MSEMKWKCPKCKTITLKNGFYPPLCKACHSLASIRIGDEE